MVENNFCSLELINEGDNAGDIVAYFGMDGYIREVEWNGDTGDINMLLDIIFDEVNNVPSNG